MTTVELDAILDPETTTLADMERLLDELCMVGGFDYGGENQIEYFVNGRIICHEIDEEYVSAMIQTFDEHGVWPWIDVSVAVRSSPSEEECRTMLADMDNDYQALWKWILMTVMEDEE